MQPLFSTHITLPPEYEPYALIFFGALMMYVGITTLRKAQRLSKHGIRTVGTLTRIETNRLVIHLGSADRSDAHDYTTNGSSRNRCTAYYSYTDEAGINHEVKGTAPAYPVIGESTTTVLYHPENPSDAIATDSGAPQLLPMIVSIVGTGMAAYGIFQLPL